MRAATVFVEVCIFCCLPILILRVAVLKRLGHWQLGAITCYISADPLHSLLLLFLRIYFRHSAYQTEKKRELRVVVRGVHGSHHRWKKKVTKRHPSITWYTQEKLIDDL